MTAGRIIFRVHAIQRMFERGISVTKIRNYIETGETIEDYSAEMLEPSRLILGFEGNRPVHVVISENVTANEITIITVYNPDIKKWQKGFKDRK
jgi:hypothetical protein